MKKKWNEEVKKGNHKPGAQDGNWENETNTNTLIIEKVETERGREEEGDRKSKEYRIKNENLHHRMLLP